MSRHDYSQSTVSAVSDAILNCKNTVENTALSIESMPYSWNTGIVNNVVTWFEVLQIFDSKEELRNMFEKADSRFSGTVQDIGKADSGASGSLENGLDSLRAFREKIGVLEEYSVQSVEAAGVFENLHGLLLSIAEKYNKIDFDKLTEEERKDYYERLIAKENLTEDDKRKIQDYIDYLQNKFIVDGNMTEEEKMFIDLYEKLHEDEKDKMNKFFDKCSNLDDTFTEEEKYEIKYLLYTSKDPSHTIIIENIDHVEVADFNGKNEGKDSMHYNNKDKKIYLNRFGKKSLREGSLGPYHGLFEEIAHCLDDYIKNDFEREDSVFKIDNFYSSDGEYIKKLEDAMKYDVEYNIDKVLIKIVDEIYEKSSIGGQMLINKEKIVSILNHCIKERVNTIDAVKKLFSLNPFEIQVVVDVLSENHVYNTAYDTYGYVLQLNWGHKWGDDYNDGMAYTEFFSQYISNAITNPEEDRLARELLPETYKIMDEMAAKKAEEIRNLRSN